MQGHSTSDAPGAAETSSTGEPVSMPGGGTIPRRRRQAVSPRFSMVTGKPPATSLVRRTKGGALSETPATSRKAARASYMATAAQATRPATQGTVMAGNIPPMAASGSATATETSSRRGAGASMGLRLVGPGSSRHRHFVQNAVQHLAGAHAFQLRFGPQQKAVFQHRKGHGADVVGAHEIAGR